MKNILTILLLGFSITLFAQDTTSSKNNQISTKWTGWKMNGERISWKEVKSNIQQVPEAVPYLKKAVNSRRMFYISAITLCASVFFIKERDLTKIPSTRNTVYIMTNLLSTSSLLYFGIRTIKNQQKAIRIHNEKRAVAY